jgi:hypothetical protein
MGERTSGVTVNRPVPFCLARCGHCQVKTYLESDNRGLSMRMALVDLTMPAEQQTGKKSRRVCKEPPAP